MAFAASPAGGGSPLGVLIEAIRAGAAHGGGFTPHGGFVPHAGGVSGGFQPHGGFQPSPVPVPVDVSHGFRNPGVPGPIVGLPEQPAGLLPGHAEVDPGALHALQLIIQHLVGGLAHHQINPSRAIPAHPGGITPGPIAY